MRKAEKKKMRSWESEEAGRAKRRGHSAKRVAVRNNIEDRKSIDFNLYRVPCAVHFFYPVSSIKHPASSIQYQVSSIEHRASSIEYPASSIQYPASSIEHPVSSTQYPLPITQYLASSIQIEDREHARHSAHSTAD
jgi:hypothetical protein